VPLVFSRMVGEKVAVGTGANAVTIKIAAIAGSSCGSSLMPPKTSRSTKKRFG